MSNVEPDWVTEFRNRLLELDTKISEFVHDGPTAEEAAEALVGLNFAKAELATCYDFLSKAVSDLMDSDNELLLPDGSRIEKKWANSRTGWQHRDIASVLARRLVDLSVDMDTGEILCTPEELIAKVLDYVQPSYWRVKELDKVGIDADKYCDVKEAKPSIIVRKAIK